MRALRVSAVFGAIVSLSAAALAQTAATAPGYKPPRLPDGKPDLQGVWTNASVTNLQRGGQYKELVVPDEEDVAPGKRMK